MTKLSTRQSWTNKLKIPQQTISQIDWKSTSSAFNSLPIQKKTETLKWNLDFCATGKNLRRWKQQSNSACPTCGSENEDITHILKCSHLKSRQQWSHPQHIRLLLNPNLAKGNNPLLLLHSPTRSPKPLITGCQPASALVKHKNHLRQNHLHNTQSTILSKTRSTKLQSPTRYKTDN